MTDILTRAKELAERAHAGQVDKAGRPYIEHVARVAAAVSDDPEAEAIAWLHDVYEDRPEAGAELVKFPGIVYWCVYVLSRTTAGSQQSYYERIRHDPITLRVKLADIADNADEARLALLDPDTANRLRRKYARALEALTGNGGM